MRLNNSVVKPLITEKSMSLAGSNKYVFETNMDMSKASIALELKKLFNVDVIDVKSLISHGKKVRKGRTNMYKTGPKKKKMVVTLKEGQKLDIMPKE